MKNPIATYKLSLLRHIRYFVIMLVLAVLFFVWWLDIKDLKTFILPIGFIVLFSCLSWIYAWITKEKAAIKVFYSGVYIEREFISWNDVKAVNLRKVDIDTITNTLVISKQDGSQLESSLDFMNVESDVIFSTILSTFKLYS